MNYSKTDTEKRFLHSKINREKNKNHKAESNYKTNNDIFNTYGTSKLKEYRDLIGMPNEKELRIPKSIRSFAQNLADSKLEAKIRVIYT